MPKGFFLSEADRDELQALLEEFRGRRLNTTGRPRPGEDLIIQAPELYAALTPIDGIPGLSADLNFGTGTGSGTGTGIGEGNTPGVAECAIYRLVETHGVNDLTDADFTRDVFNLGESAIPGDTWILVARDKFGDWWALPMATAATGGSGGGATTDLTSCRVKLTAATNIGASAQVTWQATPGIPTLEQWDDGYGSAAAATHLTVPRNGEFEILCSAIGTAFVAAVGDVFLDIYVNQGSDVKVVRSQVQIQPGDGTFAICGGTVVRLTSGATVFVKMVTSVTTMNVTDGSLFVGLRIPR